MTFVLSITILFTACHHSYSLVIQQPSFGNSRYAFQSEPFQNKQQPTHENPQPIYTMESGSPIAPKINPPRRTRHFSPISSEDEPRNKEKLWRFELDLPEVLNALKTYTGVSISDVKDHHHNEHGHLRSSKDDSILGQKLRFEVKPPNLAAIMGYLGNLVNIPAARRFNQVYYGYVEEGPGTIKSDRIDYPPRYQEGKLKHLLRLKKNIQKPRSNYN